MLNIAYPHIEGEAFEHSLKKEVAQNGRLLEILRLLYVRGDRGDCATRLWHSLSFHPNATISTSAGRIARQLGLSLPMRGSGRDRFWPVLFHGRNLGNDEFFYWMMRPEVAKVCKALFSDLIYGQEPAPFGFLFTWNPIKWDWADLDSHIYQCKLGVPVQQSWHCISKQYVEPGDHAFLFRTGKQGNGLMGHGMIVSRPHDGKVAIEWSTLLKPEAGLPLDRQYLSEHVNGKQSWAPQAPGIAIRPDALEKLLEEWNLNEWDKIQAEFQNPAAHLNSSFSEGTVRYALARRIERNPVARERCIQHHGVRCKACNLDFHEKYGAVGTGFIHVHHLDPLANGVRHVDPERDLVPVCPNCHAMLHRRTPPYSIDELKLQITNGMT